MHLFIYSVPLAWKMAQRDWAEMTPPAGMQDLLDHITDLHGIASVE